MRSKIALAVAALAAAVLGAELLARLAAPETRVERLRRDERKYLEREPLLPFFRKAGPEWVSDRPRARGESFPEHRRAGEKLVFVAGESIAFRLPSALLGETLGPDSRVVNAGMAGYGIRAVAATVVDLLNYKPATIVVLAGNNGVGPEVGGRLSRLAQYSRLARLLLDVSQGATDDDAIFAAELRRAAAAARSRGVQTVLCTAPVNLDEPPTGELPLHENSFRAGWLAYEGGRLDEARARWTEFTLEHDGDPMGFYWLGRALDRKGKAKESRAALARALELDYPDRCKPKRNELIRRAAAEENVLLADLDRAFAAAGADGSAYLDEVHWRETWHPLAARTIAAVTGSKLKPWSPPSKKALSPAEADDVLRRTVSLCVQSGSYDPPTLYERFVFAFERLWRDAPERTAKVLRDPAAARALLETSEWTRGSSDAGPKERSMVLTHAAEARWRSGGREAALALFRSALALDRDNDLARRLLGMRLLQSGKKSEGRAELDKIRPSSRERILAGLVSSDLR